MQISAFANLSSLLYNAYGACDRQINWVGMYGMTKVRQYAVRPGLIAAAFLARDRVDESAAARTVLRPTSMSGACIRGRAALTSSGTSACKGGRASVLRRIKRGSRAFALRRFV